MVRHGAANSDLLRFVPNLLRITQTLENRIDPLGLRQAKRSHGKKDHVGAPHKGPNLDNDLVQSAKWLRFVQCALREPQEQR